MCLAVSGDVYREHVIYGQQQINRRLLQMHQQQAERLAAIERDQECLKGRVEALEVQVFNQTFNNYQPPPGGVGTRRAPGYGRRRLTHRVADLERAAMTIPVGVTVNVVNPGGPLHDDSETEDDEA